VEGAPWPEQPEPTGLWSHEPLAFDARRYPKKSKPAPQQKKEDYDGWPDPPRGGLRGLWDRLFARD
jgi:hypothetical protein